MSSRCDGLAEGVGNADCVGGVHEVGDLGGVGPADGDGLGAVGVGCVEGVASEDEGDDSGVEVLVDAGEALDFDVDAVSSRTSRQTPSSNCSSWPSCPPTPSARGVRRCSATDARRTGQPRRTGSCGPS